MRRTDLRYKAANSLTDTQRADGSNTQGGSAVVVIWDGIVVFTTLPYDLS